MNTGASRDSPIEKWLIILAGATRETEKKLKRKEGNRQRPRNGQLKDYRALPQTKLKEKTPAD